VEIVEIFRSAAVEDPQSPRAIEKSGRRKAVPPTTDNQSRTRHPALGDVLLEELLQQPSGLVDSMGAGHGQVISDLEVGQGPALTAEPLKKRFQRCQ